MHTKRVYKRGMSLFLCLLLILSCVPTGILKAADTARPLYIVEDSKKADPDTNDWENYFGPEKLDTEFAGGVWTDKSVYTGNTAELPGVTLKDSNNFLVSLSSIASNLSITGHTATPTDTMLVLDLSGSMVDDTYEVGTIRRSNNNYSSVNGIDMSLIEAMIDSTNIAIDKLMKQNSNNRVGVVLYSGNTSSNQAATANTATVVLPLGRYKGIDGEYLSIDTTYTTSTLYTWRSSGWFGGGSYVESGEATYVAEDTSINVSVKNGLETEAGGNVTDASKQATGGTYIQNGLYKAMNQFLNVTDTTVGDDKPQAGAERLPVIVLMSDGAPTIATTSYTNIGDSNTGDGTTTNDRITFLTQLTAAYVRGRVASHYQENSNDQKDILFLTLGLGTENSSAATNTLYPAGSNSTLVGYWDRYLAGRVGQNVTAITGNNSLTVRREADVEAMNYVDTYYYANNAQDLIDSFDMIVGEIQLKAQSYATLVEGGDADYSGYVTFEDELGELMHVTDMKGVLMSDGNGGTVLYTGKGIAESLTQGNLGTPDKPTTRGDELVRTVRERIPSTTTSQAQQLIDNAYNDHQLYFTDDNNWSNYIGWYADANGNYVGFWDKDAGYTNAPANAVYANRSYGYLGVNGNSDMMHVVVMVRTELATLHQTVYFKIPASLLPTVQYNITLDESQPTKVEDFKQVTAVPMQLVFEVGLRSDVNSVNLEQKIAEHVKNGGHVHRNQDGTVTFYTNEWANGNDKNNNQIPDRDEIETALVAESHFHPAMDNSRYYYTEDTLVLDANGNPVGGSARPSGEYFHHRYIYTKTERITKLVPINADTLKNKAQYDAQNDQWYIPAGTIFSEVSRFKVDKTENRTNTLTYSNFPAVLENETKQDVYAFLGNNGSFTVAPATGITLQKKIEGNIQGVNDYTFDITLSNIPVGATVSPLLTDANGNALTDATISSLSGNRFSLTLPADVTAYISGIPAGVTVQVAEQINGDYHIVDIEVAGVKQATNAPATATVPDYAAGVVQMVPMVITNAPEGYGDLIISKEIVHDLSSDPAAMADKEFTFRVKLDGNKISVGDTFLTSENTTLKVGSDGYLTYDNGDAVTLKNEESITVLRIPEGTAYTVTEDDLQGFKLDSINDDNTATKASGTVLTNETSRADFINRYPDEFVAVEVPIDVDVTKVLHDEFYTYNGDEEFTFALQMLLPDNTYLSINDTSGNKYLKVDANVTEKGAFTLTFDKTGTYFFRVVELKPSELTPAGTDTAGMNYSTMRALFEVVVTDNDMDGILEVEVREEAHVTASPQYTNGDKEQIEKIVVATTFENTYAVNSTDTTLNIHKTLNDPAATHTPLTNFHFDIYPSDASGNVASGVQPTTVTTSALGDATFNILLKTEGTHYFKVSERIPAEARFDTESGKYLLNGMFYDATEYLYTVVTEINASNELEVTQRSLVDLTTKQPANPDNGVYTAQFVNDYKLTSTQVELPFSKQLIGRAPISGEMFDTRLVRTNAAFNPLTGENEWQRTYSIAANNDDLVTLTFDKVGTYHYKWSEVIPDGATLDHATGKYVLKGVSYDTTEYHITITVSDNGVGGMTAQTVMHKLGDIHTASSADFVNTYTVNGTDDVIIGGEKILDGRDLVAGEFTIGLYQDAECTKQIETTNNKADGTFAFPPLHYTVEHLGENNTEKTYTYYVKEINDGKGGMTYDPNVYTVTVTVSHQNGVLVATPSANAATLEITNTYVSTATDVTLHGNKTLVGDWSAVSNKDFTFQLFEANDTFVITNQTPVMSKTVTGQEAFEMTLHYEDGEEGFHYYVLKELIPETKTGGVGYDAGEYHITVSITDSGNGHLTQTVTMYRPGSGYTTTANFSNRYTVEPTSITLEGTKTYVNSVTNAPMAMEEGMFSFLVLEGDDEDTATPVATGYNLADGKIKFTPIRYTKAGTHVYKVVELAGDKGGVTYDVNTVFTVTVTVTDNGNGTLSANANYSAPVKFENTYTHASAQVTFNGVKELKEDWNAVAPANKIFNFDLYETGADFAIGDTVKDTTVNETDGSFTFGALTYTTEGTHYYVIKERSGSADKGITYDDTKYQITVKVEDDGKGNLIPTVTATDSSVSITPDAANSRLVTVDNLKFANTYQAKPAQYTPEVIKFYKGEAMKAFDFVLTVDGKDKQTKQNDTTTGKVIFDTLSLDTAKVYEVKVREQSNALWGLIRWDENVYTITLHVEDNGAGQLMVNEGKTTIVSDKGSKDLVFRNTHHSVITKKDVFAANDPTISIDGKTVEIGDILLYKISYTNHDIIPVDITITDVIPEYTAYVEGSADHDGKFITNTLNWTMENVQPDTTVTVSFQVKVVKAGDTVINGATVLEGNNKYETNKVSTPVKEDAFVKDVFVDADATVSVDGEAVEKGDTLLYTLTYTNTDDFVAEVTLTDTIPEHTTYVEGSADNDATVVDGVITWKLTLAAGESKTVSFKVTVNDFGASVTNKATALEGENMIESNQVSTPSKAEQVPETPPTGSGVPPTESETPPTEPATPDTGDNFSAVLYISMMCLSAMGIVVLTVYKKRTDK